MLITSQNKQKIVILENINCLEIENGTYITSPFDDYFEYSDTEIKARVNGQSYFLGRYYTLENAKQVLKEIAEAHARNADYVMPNKSYFKKPKKIELDW